MHGGIHADLGFQHTADHALHAVDPVSYTHLPFSAFLSGALFTAVPGIIAQLVLIPLIITALQKARLMD